MLEIGLTDDLFSKIVHDTISNEDLKKIKKVDPVDNQLALEIMSHAEKKFPRMVDCRKVFFVVQGKEGSYSDQALYNAFHRLKRDEQVAKNNHSKKRISAVQSFHQEFFKFPKSVTEICEEVMLLEEEESRKIISQYKERINKLRVEWIECEAQNNHLQELLEIQYCNEEELREKNMKLVEEQESLKKRFSKVCVELQELNKEKQQFSLKEINRRERRREKVLAILKEKKQEQFEKCKELLTDKKRLEAVVLEKENNIRKLTDDLIFEMAEKRKYQKSRNYYMKLAHSAHKKSHQDMLDHNSTIKELKDQVLVLENQKLEIEDQMESMLRNELSELKNADGSYKNDIRAMYQDLVLCGVGIKETKNVIISVMKNLLKYEIDAKKLPSASFARGMYEEARLLALAQIGCSVGQEQSENNTLQTDGTTKRGHHYGTIDIATSEGRLVAGVRPMAAGDSETTLTILKEVLNEIEKVCMSSETKMAKKILMSIKNTMSDRHGVQKKFNSLLEEYRVEICSEIRDDWDQLSKEEQSNLTKVNDFFCGLHFVVGLADQAEVCLKSYERLVYGDDVSKKGCLAYGGYSNGESGTLRLVRTLCKAVEEHGCEKSGRMREFELHLQASGYAKNPLINFKGNRFNVLFYNGGVAYSIHEQCHLFFQECHTDNKLLSAVHHDLNERIHIIGCRALGFVNKFITGPLWRLLVKEKHVLDMNKHYNFLEKKCAELSKDASNFIMGKEVFFGDESLISKDNVYDKLLVPNEGYDLCTKQLLELFFASFSIITNRMLHDHLEGGKYDNPSESLRNESVSTPNANTNPETDFGFLDRLKIMKPNSNDITYEAIIMCRSNKMSSWRDRLSEFDKELWMNWVRKCKKEHYKMFIERRAEIRKLLNEKRLASIEARKQKEIRMAKVREDLVKEIQDYGGLWNDSMSIDANLANQKGEKGKIAALKCQLKFRHKVLCHTFVDSDLYLFSKNKVARTSAELSANLKKLIDQVVSANTSVTEPDSDNVIDIVIPSVKMDKEKLRLEMLKQKEVDKIESLRKDTSSSKVEPPCKRKKVGTCSEKSIRDTRKGADDKLIPEVDSIEELVGKRVVHFTSDGEKKPRWYKGVVVMRKPMTDSELIIRYDVEDEKLYAFDYSEYSELGLIELVEVEPEWAVGKLINHRFETEDGGESWWEKGRILCYKDGQYTMEYYLANDSDIDIAYEQLVLPLEDDYLAHDVKFL